MTKAKSATNEKTADTPTGDENAEVENTPKQDLTNAAPASATLTPPAPKSSKGDEKPESTLGTDAGADALRVTASRPLIRDTDGNKVDADGVFTDTDPNTGLRTCRVRLLKHTTETIYQRPVTSLLIARGSVISDAGAQVILNQIKAEDA